MDTIPPFLILLYDDNKNKTFIKETFLHPHMQEYNHLLPQHKDLANPQSFTSKTFGYAKYGWSKLRDRMREGSIEIGIGALFVYRRIDNRVLSS
jgi:hypothetical protein